MSDTAKLVTLTIVTPEGVAAQVECSSVQLTLDDGQNQKGGGGYGVRYGHTHAVLLLAEGRTSARKDGGELITFKTGKGFATVKENEVVAVVDRAKTKAAQ